MKKIFTTFCASLLAVAASAQVDGALYPRANSVYSPSEYPVGITVTYSDSVDLSSAKAIVTINDSTYEVSADSTFATKAYFNIASSVASLSDGDTFGVAISGIDATAAESLSGTYKYYAEVPQPTISPAAGTVDSKTFTAAFTYSAPMVATYIDYASGSGMGMVATVVDGDSVASNTISVSVAERNWSTITTSPDLTITLDGLMDADGFYYPNLSVTYQYGEDVVNYLGVEPDPESNTYADAYDAWYIDFKFDKEIAIPEDENVVTISFYNDLDDILATVSLDDSLVTCGYNYFMRCYTVELEVPEIPSSAESYDYAIIELQGITHNDVKLCEQPSATYYADLSSEAKSQRIGLSAIKDTMIIDNKTFDIFNTNGILVKKNLPITELKNLSKGLYLVGGKKIIVK